MEITDAFGMLMFFAIFEILGGGAVGIAVRAIVQRDFSQTFFLLWGLGFGGIPLIIGSASFLSMHQPMYFVAQLFTFFAPLAALALIPRDLFQGTSSIVSAEGGTALVGAVMTLIGGAIVLITFRMGINAGLCIGAVFAFIGIALLFNTALRVLHTL